MSEMPTLNQICGTGFKNGIMIIDESPKEEDFLMQEPFMSREGLLFRKIIKEAGIKDSKLYFTYLYRSQDIDKEKSKIFFKEEIKVVNPKVIIALGANTYKVIQKIFDKTYKCPSPAYILNRGKKYQETVVKQLKEIYAKLD